MEYIDHNRVNTYTTRYSVEIVFNVASKSILGIRGCYKFQDANLIQVPPPRTHLSVVIRCIGTTIKIINTFLGTLGRLVARTFPIVALGNYKNNSKGRPTTKAW